ncbi:MAG: NUDIX hydrolase [Clostridia bacterium]|nr:NUDIX hydrolase [Clostridia bacterium]
MERNNELYEKQVSSERIYDGRILHLYVDKVELPNGKVSTREYLRHQGAVCVLPVTDAGEAIMEEQFRYPFGKVLLEAPAGKVDPGEEPLAAAYRELAEETGCACEELIPLGDFYPSCAYTDEIIRLYLAKGLTVNEQKLDADEFLTLRRIPLAELKQMLLRGEIPDGKTQAILWRALAEYGM